jgi:hypothetical protein
MSTPFFQHPRRVPAPLGASLRAMGAAFLLAAVTSPLLGQQPRSRLQLIILEAESNTPVADAQVMLDGSVAGMTDESGAVLLDVSPAVRMAVGIRRIGYASRDLNLAVPAGETIILSVPMELQPVELSAVGVDVTVGPRSTRLAGFYQRMRTGAGEYITREEIERRNPRDLSDLFRSIPGIRLLSAPGGDRPVLGATRSLGLDVVNPDGAGCAIQYFLDGSPIKPIHDGVVGAEVMLQEIEGIEIYRRGATVASQYQRMNGGCGVILIWKKERE